jgi:hypothetical protein
MVKDTTQAKQEGLNQLEYRFPTYLFRRNDRKVLFPQHTSYVSSYWLYAHDSFEDEIFIEGAQDWEEVLHRKANPNMTKFKAMTIDDQVETTEKKYQESLMVREENRVAEVVEAQRRGIFLLEEDEKSIARFEREPLLNTLIGPLGITPIRASEEVEPTNSNEITPGETVDQENPSPMSPHEGS